jgi:threonine/homoserine/homoserine lactone efflux protein
MISSGRLVEFIATSMAIIIIPGPSVLFTLARGVAWGRFVGVLTAVGNGLGMFLLAILVAIGLGPVLSHSKPASVTLQILGGAYLLWLGSRALRHRHEHAAAMTQREEVKPRAIEIIRQGFVVGFLNPKVLIFYIAIFPHFVNRNHGNTSLQLLLLGVIFCSLSILSDGTWGFIAGTARAWLSESPHRLVFLRTVGGVVMVGLGVLIITTASVSA